MYTSLVIYFLSNMSTAFMPTRLLLSLGTVSSYSACSNSFTPLLKLYCGVKRSLWSSSMSLYVVIALSIYNYASISMVPLFQYGASPKFKSSLYNEMLAQISISFADLTSSTPEFNVLSLTGTSTPDFDVLLSFSL